MLVVLGNGISSTLRAHFRSRASGKGASALCLAPVSFGVFKSSEPFTEPYYRKGGQPLPDFEEKKALLAGQPVTIVQSTAAPVSERAFHLLLAVRTLRRYGVGQITLAMPFAAFARQDRKFPGRFCSVAGDDFPHFLKKANEALEGESPAPPMRIITQEVHSKAAEKFYVSHFGRDNVAFLSSTTLFAEDIRAHESGDIVIGAPDGADKPGDAGQRRAYDLATLFWKAASLSPDEQKEKMFRISKAHVGGQSTKVVSFDGSVAGKTGVIVDDMTDSGGTVLNAGRTLKENGAIRTVAYLTHALFNARALRKILTETMPDGRPVIDRLVVADTVPGIGRKIARLEKEFPGISGRITVLETGSLMEKRILSFVPG